MDYEGKIYRPWVEADSLIIQATIGCSNNQCTFCDMFREKRFRVKDMDVVFSDIEEARRLYSHVGSIFLTDGNVLVLKTEKLIKILNKLTETFPECKRISLYSGLNDFRRKSVEELKELRDAGLTLAYSGLESGDMQTLERIRKGLTPEEAEEGMAKAHEAGIDVLLSVIFGIGGKDRSREHIVETTSLLNTLKPQILAPMALTIQPGTELAREVEAGEFVQATPLQMLEEEKYLLENLEDFGMYYLGDHGNNIVPMKGELTKHRDYFIARVEQAVEEHPVVQEEVHCATPW